MRTERHSVADGDARAPGRKKTSMSTVSAAVNYAERCGLELDDIADALGVSVSTLNGFDGAVPDDRPAKFMRRLEGLGRDPALTINIARRTPLTYFGGIERAVYYAPTARAMMDLFFQFAWILSARLGSFIDETDQYVTYHFPHPMGHLDNGMFREIAVAMFWRLIRTSIGRDGGLAEVNLGYTPNGAIQQYTLFFDAPVTFGVFPGDHVLVFRKEVLETKNVHADPVLYRLGVRYLEELVRAKAGGAESAQYQRLVRAVARAVRKRAYTVDAVAHNMRMSRRSVQRLANAYGVTVNELLGEARIEIAKNMIADDPGVNPTILTERLGYADESSFRRSFARYGGGGLAGFRRLFKPSP